MSGKNKSLAYLGRNLSIVIGLVFIWRGIWYALDMIDLAFFQGSHFYTAFFGILLGLFILYYPDRDLKEIEKL